MFLGYKLSSTSSHNLFSSQRNSHLDDLVKLISEKYVDTLDEKKLYRSGIEGILKNLDPHTVYIPANELERVNEELEGTFYGIGVEFYVLNDTITISSVIPDGPSINKNIVPGDKIIRIDDSLIAGKNLGEDEIIQRIRGKKNTTVNLGLLRFDGSQQKVKVKRGNVPMKSVTAFFKLNEETGYIKIELFSETTYDEFKEALTDLVKQGIKKLVIDVRENPGGYMDAVAMVADELVAGEHVIVSTRGKQKKDSLLTHREGLFEQGDLCILVDENSASASEILAGAIQDLDRGTIIGRRTYGKGLVQEQFELPDHSAIRITTARYYLPSGRCIQRSYAEGKEKYKHDIIDRFSNGELQQEDSTLKNSTKYFTVKKKIVYGEEGISPTIFVPLDTIYHSQLDDFYTEHIAEGFAQRYFFFHKKEFDVFTSLEKFDTGFNINDMMKSEINSFLSQHKINPAILENKILQQEIVKVLKAQFAKLLFGNNGKFKELYSDDAFILKALKEME